MLPKYSYTRTTGSSATPSRARYLESEPAVTSVFLACANEHMRRRIAKLLAATVDIEVVGEAGDGSQAVEGVQMVRPDVLLMEIDLPACTNPTPPPNWRAPAPTSP